MARKKKQADEQQVEPATSETTTATVEQEPAESDVGSHSELPADPIEDALEDATLAAEGVEPGEAIEALQGDRNAFSTVPYSGLRHISLPGAKRALERVYDLQRHVADRKVAYELAKGRAKRAKDDLEEAIDQLLQEIDHQKTASPGPLFAVPKDAAPSEPGEPDEPGATDGMSSDLRPGELDGDDEIADGLDPDIADRVEKGFDDLAQLDDAMTTQVARDRERELLGEDATPEPPAEGARNRFRGASRKGMRGIAVDGQKD